MQIKAKCKYDYKACKAMAHILSYKKRKPEKVLIAHFILAIALAFINFVLIRLMGGTFTNMLIFILCLFIISLELTAYFLLPFLQYRSMSKMKDMENKYVFRDEDFTASADYDEYKGESVIKYSLLEKVMETGEYFLLFENKRQVIMVDKATIEEGTAEQLREKLSSALGKNYIICKY